MIGNMISAVWVCLQFHSHHLSFIMVLWRSILIQSNSEIHSNMTLPLVSRWYIWQLQEKKCLDCLIHQKASSKYNLSAYFKFHSPLFLMLAVCTNARSWLWSVKRSSGLSQLKASLRSMKEKLLQIYLLNAELPHHNMSKYHLNALKTTNKIISMSLSLKMFQQTINIWLTNFW